jgi:hypothetical protein
MVGLLPPDTIIVWGSCWEGHHPDLDSQLLGPHWISRLSRIDATRINLWLQPICHRSTHKMRNTILCQSIQVEKMMTSMIPWDAQKLLLPSRPPSPSPGPQIRSGWTHHDKVVPWSRGQVRLVVEWWWAPPLGWGAVANSLSRSVILQVIYPPDLTLYFQHHTCLL